MFTKTDNYKSSQVLTCTLALIAKAVVNQNSNVIRHSVEPLVMRTTRNFRVKIAFHLLPLFFTLILNALTPNSNKFRTKYFNLFDIKFSATNIRMYSIYPHIKLDVVITHQVDEYDNATTTTNCQITTHRTYLKYD